MYQFLTFASLENLKHQISEGEVFSFYLEQLKCDIDKRLTDIFQLNVPKWIMDPFKVDLFEVNVDLLETISDLQTDLKLKVNFSKERYENFWTQKKN